MPSAAARARARGVPEREQALRGALADREQFGRRPADRVGHLGHAHDRSSRCHPEGMQVAAHVAGVCVEHEPAGAALAPPDAVDHPAGGHLHVVGYERFRGLPRADDLDVSPDFARSRVKTIAHDRTPAAERGLHGLCAPGTQQAKACGGAVCRAERDAHDRWGVPAGAMAPEAAVAGYGCHLPFLRTHEVLRRVGYSRETANIANIANVGSKRQVTTCGRLAAARPRGRGTVNTGIENCEHPARGCSQFRGRCSQSRRELRTLRVPPDLRVFAMFAMFAVLVQIPPVISDRHRCRMCRR